MKNIKLEPCWQVSTWAGEIKQGMGFRFELDEGYSMTYDRVMFYADGKFKLHHAKEVFFEHAKAVDYANKQKTEYKEYLQKEITKNTEKLKELTTP